MGEMWDIAPRMARMVEQQVGRWQLEERRQSASPPPVNVAFSRFPRSQAAELGQRVAEALGFGFFGIAIVEEIARSQGVQRELVSGVDEHVRSLIERFVVDSFRRRPFLESDYVHGVVRTIATLGQRGRAVLLGRGSAQILPPERALRVLVVAPTADRIERLAKDEDLGLEAARRRLEREDAQRREFIQHHFRADPDDPTLYDLVVNTATLGTEDATPVVVSALARRFPGQVQPAVDLG